MVEFSEPRADGDRHIMGVIALGPSPGGVEDREGIRDSLEVPLEGDSRKLLEASIEAIKGLRSRSGLPDTFKEFGKRPPTP